MAIISQYARDATTQARSTLVIRILMVILMIEMKLIPTITIIRSNSRLEILTTV